MIFNNSKSTEKKESSMLSYYNYTNTNGDNFVTYETNSSSTNNSSNYSSTSSSNKYSSKYNYSNYNKNSK